MPYEETAAPQVNAQEESIMVITPRKAPRLRWLWSGKIGPAFWTIAGLISLIVNVILVVALISVGRELFTLKSLVQDQLIGGLYSNFQQMDQAHIRTQIPVATEVPAKFDLPLDTTTNVTLTENVTVSNVTISNLNAGALYISQAVASITLPAGTQLPVALKLTVPVDQKIPVNLLVDVDIPLQKTELHAPFVGLQEVVKPYYSLLQGLPDSWQATICAVYPDTMCDK